jgi:hypothetical protein
LIYENQKTSTGVLFVTFLTGCASVPPLATKQIVTEIPNRVPTASVDAPLVYKGNYWKESSVL